MKEKPISYKIKRVNHANLHTAQKTESVPKSKTKWVYDLVDQKIKRPQK